MRLFSLNLFQGCVSHLQTHMVVLLKYFSRVRLSPPDSCGCSPQKNSFQGCVSHLFLPYLVLSSSSPHVENGSNSSKVLFSTFGLPSIFSLSLVRPLHVLEMEESAAKSSFPLSDHPQSFPYHQLDLSTCWKWKNQRQSPHSHFRITLNLFSIISQTSPHAGNGRINSKVLLPTFGSPQSFLYQWSDLSLMVHFFPFIFFSPSLNQLLYSHGDRKSDRKRFPSPLPITLHPL